jgi:hypothetical protein
VCVCVCVCARARAAFVFFSCLMWIAYAVFAAEWAKVSV